MTKSPEIVQMAHKANSLQLSLSVLNSLPDFGGALCAKPEANPEYWFAETSKEVAAAKAICRGCPALDICMIYAISDSTLDGIWAGTDEADRARLRGETDSVVSLENYTEGLLIVTGVAAELAETYGVTQRTIARWKDCLRDQPLFASDVELAA